MESLGKRIRNVRRKRKWTQAKLARALGVKIGTLSGYEREYRRPDVLMLDRIASTLGVSVDYLLGRTDDPTFGRTDDPISGRAKKPTPEGVGDSVSDEAKSGRAGVSQRDPLVDLALEAIPELSPEGRQAVERFLEYCRESDRLRRDKVDSDIRRSE